MQIKNNSARGGYVLLPEDDYDESVLDYLIEKRGESYARVADNVKSVKTTFGLYNIHATLLLNEDLANASRAVGGAECK